MNKTLLVSALLSLSFSLNLSAATLTSTIGDKDGFGIGAIDGASFNFAAIGSGDGDGTDVWSHGDNTWSFTYDLSGLGSLTSASLDIFHGGDGLGVLSSVSIDGVAVGTLTDGDGVGPGYNYAFLDTLDLSSYLYLFVGANSVTIDVASSSDGWALDYMELTLSDTVSAVPVPAAVFMFAPALLGFMGLRRKAKATIA